ncbi:toxin biosynthesis regulatory protein AflJ [Plenodomus tracheiphilus IPT5]|uniref:Toxin biosynthesis regulatory protein AflJ n=1 Tax=Plenodomus tracheiphilus IPT5 TaxID=1408161 RepID=A0A6A7AWF0_9PLEO|nr:toxin biosynthesis regulatory protein AflJ [Plenodomus tracheiphilus IPT5]
MDLVQLDALCSELTVAAESLKALCEGSGNNSPASIGLFKDSLHPPIQLQDDISTARSNLCGVATRLQILLADPTCFIRQMAIQNQLLACLKWLGEYQITAYVPLSDSISLEELAELADVSEYTLSRVVRMTATAGFLHEPQLGYIAHTPLSSSFTNELTYFDAAMFLANRVAPSALDMTYFPQKQEAGASTMAVLKSAQTFALDRAQEPKLNRQWLAYYHSVGGMNHDVTTLIHVLNWHSLGGASVVHTLAHVSHALQVIVQTYDYTPADLAMKGLGNDEQDAVASRRIIVQRRKPAIQQPVRDAAVYILQPSFDARSTEDITPQELLAIELKSHYNILQANPSAVLIVAPVLLPEPGSVPVNMEVQARIIDFAEIQFNKRSAMEVTELFQLTESICDAHGRLIVTNRLRSVDGATIALAVQYQSLSERTEFVGKC